MIPSRMPELDTSAPIPSGPQPRIPDPKAVEAAMKADKVTARDAAASAVEVAQEIEENARLMARLDDCTEAMEDNPENVTEG